MKLSLAMREVLWSMLKFRRNPRGSMLILDDDRTVQALVRRGLLSRFAGGYGYVIDEAAARKALGGKP